MKKITVSSILLLFLIPVFVSAETVVRTADSVSIEENQQVANDLYVAANTISMSGEVAGDMYAVGGAVTVNGPVEADFTVIGGSVQLHASVTDDVRVIAGEVVLADYVGGDVFVFGGLLKVLSTAEVAGDIFFFGGNAEINGSVGGSIMGTSETIRINAPVAGAVNVTASRGVTLGARAAIEGDVQYTSSVEIVRAQDAVVGGSLIQNTGNAGDGSFDVRSTVIPILISLFGTLVLYLLAKPLVQKMTAVSARTAAISGVWGVLLLLVLPVIVGVLLVTVLGALVGVVTLLLFIVSLLVAYLALPILLGTWIHRYMFKTPEIQLLSVVTGVLVVHGILFVPMIGPSIVVALFLISFGLLVRVCAGLLSKLQ